MKYRIAFLMLCILFSPNVLFGACSNANLTRCLDSVCAINVGANPAARCQYCGSSAAGEPGTANGMKKVSAGASSKYLISDKELKKAPTDPGARYVWATKQCIAKVSGCSADDVSDIYDPLIEQSCKAAGISAEMANLTEEINTEKTQTSCSSDITTCIVNAKRCSADYRNCESDSDFDKHFSDCSIAATGCDAYLKIIRSNLIASRDTSIKNAANILQSIVSAYQKSRDQKLNSTKTACKDGSAKRACIQRVCNNNMRNKCGEKVEIAEVDRETREIMRIETTLAEELCKFYDIACERLK